MCRSASSAPYWENIFLLGRLSAPASILPAAPAGTAAGGIHPEGRAGNHPLTPPPIVWHYIPDAGGRRRHGRRNQGDCQDEQGEEDPAVPPPPGRTEDLLRMAAGTGGRLHRGEGTEGEAETGKGGVRDGRRSRQSAPTPPCRYEGGSAA